MPRPALLAAALAALAGCATVPPRVEPGEVLLPTAEAGAREDLRDTPAPPPPETAAAQGADAWEPSGGEGHSGDGERVARRDRAQAPIVSRALALVGTRGPFRVGAESFRDDCSGFVQAVYAAAGLDLRGEIQRAAPRERRGALAAWLAAREHGRTFGADEPPEPGDLVFWHDTYDRNRNRRTDDRFTHMGVVERVEDGTVVFLHRGAKGVARGVMTLARRHEARTADGEVLNSHVRARGRRSKGGLAGELFAGFARLDGVLGRSAVSGASLRARTPPRAAVRTRSR